VTTNVSPARNSKSGVSTASTTHETLYTCGVTTPYQFYVSITGSKQGSFTGSSQVDQSQHPGRLPAIRFSGDIIGQVSVGSAGKGLMKQSPFMITRELDGASPQLLHAATTNERLPSVLLELVSSSDGGHTFETFYTIKLTNAGVSHYRMYTSPLPEGGSNIFELEDVTFSYQRIDVQHQDGTSASTAAAGSRAPSNGAGTPATGSITNQYGQAAPPIRTPTRFGLANGGQTLSTVMRDITGVSSDITGNLK
jgi:type VI secretion system Hcp family effector